MTLWQPMSVSSSFAYSFQSVTVISRGLVVKADGS